MAEEIRRKPSNFALLAGFFFALCTLLALLVTVYEAWQEHVQARWPRATAQISACTVESADAEEPFVSIECSIHLMAADEAIDARVTSRKTRSLDKAFFRFPRNQVGEAQMRSWVDQHPPGTSIAVHYDPAQPSRVALVESDMPLGAARTPGNVRVLSGFAAIAVLLLTIGLVRRRSQGAQAS